MAHIEEELSWHYGRLEDVCRPQTQICRKDKFSRSAAHHINMYFLPFAIFLHKLLLNVLCSYFNCVEFSEFLLIYLLFFSYWCTSAKLSIKKQNEWWPARHCK